MSVGERESTGTARTVGSRPQRSPAPPSSFEVPNPTLPQQTTAGEVTRVETQLQQASSRLARRKP
jgi:hypothetical protein